MTYKGKGRLPSNTEKFEMDGVSVHIFVIFKGKGKNNAVSEHGKEPSMNMLAVNRSDYTYAESVIIVWQKTQSFSC